MGPLGQGGQELGIGPGSHVIWTPWNPPESGGGGETDFSGSLGSQGLPKLFEPSRGEGEGAAVCLDIHLGGDLGHVL